MPQVADKIKVRRMIGGLWGIYLRKNLMSAYPSHSEALANALILADFEAEVAVKVEELERVRALRQAGD